LYKGEGKDMKKKIIMVFAILVVLSVCICVGFYIYKKNDGEAVRLFNQYAILYVDLKKDVTNVEVVEKQIQKVQYVKSTELDSKENKLNQYNEAVGKYKIDSINADIFNDSLYVRFDFNKGDLEKIEEIKNKLIDEISNIEGIEEIESGCFEDLVEAYNTKGTVGLKIVCKLLEAM